MIGIRSSTHSLKRKQGKEVTITTQNHRSFSNEFNYLSV